MSTQTANGLAPVPEQLGRYRVVGRLATGGMAELFVTRMPGDHRYERFAVCKRIAPALAEEATFVNMFREEMQIAALLHHANIVHVYEVSESQGNCFMAMEFLEGADVNRMVRRLAEQNRSLPLSVTLNIVTSICSGLHYVHQRSYNGKTLGIVHRDVSPQNIFVTYDGDVKLIDFGVMKAAIERERTEIGKFKGKVRYMAPEQARSQPVDARTDVFALGIVLWELTTGRRMYDDLGDFESIRQLLTGQPVLPSQYVSGYPPQLERIVMKALAREPDDRFVDAEQMQLAIEDFARDAKLTLSKVVVRHFMRAFLADNIRQGERKCALPPPAIQVIEAEPTMHRQRPGVPLREVVRQVAVALLLVAFSTMLVLSNGHKPSAMAAVLPSDAEAAANHAPASLGRDSAPEPGARRQIVETVVPPKRTKGRRQSRRASADFVMEPFAD